MEKGKKLYEGKAKIIYATKDKNQAFCELFRRDVPPQGCLDEGGGFRIFVTIFSHRFSRGCCLELVAIPASVKVVVQVKIPHRLLRLEQGGLAHR